jgi:mono/diheme cytochrome c family protein
LYLSSLPDWNNEATERRLRLTLVRREDVMPGRAASLIFATALIGFTGGIPIYAPGADQTSAPSQSPSEGKSDDLLAKGKAIFLQRCARCHNESGDKPLTTGVPLNQRGLSTEVIAQAVNGRLRDRTEDERRAVTLYISGLMDNKDSGKK